MKIRVEDSKRGVYDKEVPDNYLMAPTVEARPTIEERIALLENESIALKKQLSAVTKMNAG